MSSSKEPSNFGGTAPVSVDVTVFYAAKPWLGSPEDLEEMPVSCLVSKHGNTVEPFRVDLAVCARRMSVTLPSQRSFRAALALTLEELGYKVGLISLDRIDWEGAGPT